MSSGFIRSKNHRLKTLILLVPVLFFVPKQTLEVFLSLRSDPSSLSSLRYSRVRGANHSEPGH